MKLEITQILDSKSKVLQKTIKPDVLPNRFYLLYNDDFDLYKISTDFGEHFIAVHLENRTLYVSMYKRSISKSIFEKFIKFLFNKYAEAENLNIDSTKTWIGNTAIMRNWAPDIRKHTIDGETVFSGTVSREMFLDPESDHDGYDDLAVYISEEDMEYAGTEMVACMPSLGLADKFMPHIEGDKQNMTFADIGCGTGFVMQKVDREFRKVIGIERDKRIYGICVENVRKFNMDNVSIISSDVENIDDSIIDSIDVFYLYNPFVGETFRRFMKKINESISRRDRFVQVVYANPVCKDIMLSELGQFLDIKVLPKDDLFEILILRYRKIM